MRRFHCAALAAVAVIGFASMASAADLPTRGPVYKAAPAIAAPTWTGFYVGLNAGGAWGGNNSVNTVSSALSDFTVVPSYAGNSALGASGGVPVGDSSGFMGGVQIGYNQQFGGAFVAGIETDIQGFGKSGNSGSLATVVGPFAWAGAPEVINTSITSSKQLDYLGTVRGRLGYLATPSVLLYGTGGLAYGHVSASTSISQTNNDCVFFPGDCLQGATATAGTYSQTRYGWTLGGGAEWMLLQNWSVKAEYIYYDLGSVNFGAGALVTTSGTFLAAGGPAVITSQSTTHFNGNIARIGLNYKFGG